MPQADVILRSARPTVWDIMSGAAVSDAAVDKKTRKKQVGSSMSFHAYRSTAGVPKTCLFV